MQHRSRIETNDLLDENEQQELIDSMMNQVNYVLNNILLRNHGCYAVFSWMMEIARHNRNCIASTFSQYLLFRFYAEETMARNSISITYTCIPLWW